mgnify:CR=1 FL=1
MKGPSEDLATAGATATSRAPRPTPAGTRFSTQSGRGRSRTAITTATPTDTTAMGTSSQNAAWVWLITSAAVVVTAELMESPRIGARSRRGRADRPKAHAGPMPMAVAMASHPRPSQNAVIAPHPGAGASCGPCAPCPDHRSSPADRHVPRDRSTVPQPGGGDRPNRRSGTGQGFRASIHTLRRTTGRRASTARGAGRRFALVMPETMPMPGITDSYPSRCTRKPQSANIVR